LIREFIFSTLLMFKTRFRWFGPTFIETPIESEVLTNRVEFLGKWKR
jgi:hypothetical protein